MNNEVLIHVRNDLMNNEVLIHVNYEVAAGYNRNIHVRIMKTSARSRYKDV